MKVPWGKKYQGKIRTAMKKSIKTSWSSAPGKQISEVDISGQL